MWHKLSYVNYYLFVVHSGRRAGHRLVEPATEEKIDFETFAMRNVGQLVVQDISNLSFPRGKQIRFYVN